MTNYTERSATLAEDKRIKAEQAKSDPRLQNSYGVLEEWEKGLKQDAGRYKRRVHYRDMYEPTMNYD